MCKQFERVTQNYPKFPCLFYGRRQRLGYNTRYFELEAEDEDEIQVFVPQIREYLQGRTEHSFLQHGAHGKWAEFKMRLKE